MASMKGERSLIMKATALTAAMILALASAAMGARVEITDTDDLGGGMYGYTLTAFGEDGQEKSFFIEITVECLNPGVDQLHQQKAIIIPGVLEYDVNTEADADTYNGLGTPPYDKARDSWYSDPFYKDGNIQVEIPDVVCLMHLESGTNPNVAYYEDAKAAYIALTGQAHVYSTLFRAGAPFPFDFIIPEPATLLMVVAGAGLIIRRKR